MDWNPRYVWGVVFALASLIVSTIALLIQKHAAVFEAGRPFYKRPRLVTGLLLNLFSEVALSPFAILYAPLSLISPLGGFGMIFNGIFTHFGCICGIRERMKWKGWMSTGLIVLGVGMVAISSNDPNTSAQWTARELEDRVKSPRSLTTIAACACVVVALLAATRCLKGWTNALARACSAGIMGTLSVFWVKILMNIFADTPNDAIELLVLGSACLVFGAPMQVVILNNALRLHAATLVIPIYLSTMTISMALVGGVVFDELSSMSHWRVSVFVVGMTLTVVGVSVLSEPISTSTTTLVADVVVDVHGDAPTGSADVELTVVAKSDELELIATDAESREP